MNPAAPDDAWVEARRAGAVRALRSATSATGLGRVREGFGWHVRPAAGSILASPRTAAWDPEPDYFHHWVRDAAVAIRVLPDVMAAADDAGRRWWREAFRDHVAFCLRITDPARRGPGHNPLRPSTRADHLRFLRPDGELRALGGAAWLGEPRFAADGTPDLERWSRPQNDGPALRAAALLRVTKALPELMSAEVETLLARDLEYLRDVAGRACIGPWEEEPARRTTFTLIAQWDALDRGADWRQARGEDDAAAALRGAAKRVAEVLHEAADPDETLWRESVEAPRGAVDSATVLAILHAERADGPLALDAPRTLGTLATLERDFARLYPINRGRAVPAMGRWAGDGFFGGNPWFPVTLGCAELHYRIAARTRDPRPYAKAELWMALIAAVAPEGGALPEQFHRETGEPVSCRDLTWSAAAFIGAAAARDEGRQALAGR